MRLALLALSVLWSFPSGRPRSVGPSRLWLHQLEKSSEQGFSVPRSKMWVGVGSSVLARPSGRRGHPEAAGVGASAPVGEVGRSQKTGATPPRPDLPVGDWTALLPCHSDIWVGP